VLAEFSKLNFDWAGEVIKDFDRFLKISNFYRILVDQKKGREDYSEEKYMKDILGFFTDIPESISRICDTVRREYLRIQ
jgi:N-glycosylase/DNA lyase